MPASQGDRLCWPLALLGGNPAIRWARCRVAPSLPWARPSLSTQVQASGVLLTARGPYRMGLEPAWAHVGRWRLHLLHLQLWPPARAPWHRCAPLPLALECLSLAAWSSLRHKVVSASRALVPWGRDIKPVGVWSVCCLQLLVTCSRWMVGPGCTKVHRHLSAHTVHGHRLTLSSCSGIAWMGPCTT